MNIMVAMEQHLGEGHLSVTLCTVGTRSSGHNREAAVFHSDHYRQVLLCDVISTGACV